MYCSAAPSKVPSTLCYLGRVTRTHRTEGRSILLHCTVIVARNGVQPCLSRRPRVPSPESRGRARGRACRHQQRRPRCWTWGWGMHARHAVSQWPGATTVVPFACAEPRCRCRSRPNRSPSGPEDQQRRERAEHQRPHARARPASGAAQIPFIGHSQPGCVRQRLPELHQAGLADAKREAQCLAQDGPALVSFGRSGLGPGARGGTGPALAPEALWEHLDEATALVADAKAAKAGHPAVGSEGAPILSPSFRSLTVNLLARRVSHEGVVNHCLTVGWCCGMYGTEPSSIHLRV
jgi:hypothetical protein